MARRLGACFIILMLTSEQCAYEIFIKDYNKRTSPVYKFQQLPQFEGKFFQSYLRNFRMGRIPIAAESDYKWVARVIHSTLKDYPQFCTAVCIEERIFMTAAKCTFTLHLTLTTIIYKGKRFPAIAFVMPDVFSNQLFDDIAFIVVKNMNYDQGWDTVPLIDKKRTDNSFRWFDANKEYEKEGKAFTLVGYAEKATPATLRRNIEEDTSLTSRKRKKPKFGGYTRKAPDLLYEMSVTINISACESILTNRSKAMKSFHVPCCYPFTYQEFVQNPAKLLAFFLPLGGAVYSKKNNILIGIATWTTKSSKDHLFSMPVGFAVPNSDNFFKDRDCARKIRDDETEDPSAGYYDSLCNT